MDSSSFLCTKARKLTASDTSCCFLGSRSDNGLPPWLFFIRAASNDTIYFRPPRFLARLRRAWNRSIGGVRNLGPWIEPVAEGSRHGISDLFPARVAPAHGRVCRDRTVAHLPQLCRAKRHAIPVGPFLVYTARCQAKSSTGATSRGRRTLGTTARSTRMRGNRGARRPWQGAAFRNRTAARFYGGDPAPVSRLGTPAPRIANGAPRPSLECL